jgi:uncharacterized protein
MATCPTCRPATAWRDNVHRPFCSLVCRLIDLGVWLDERYRIPEEPSVTTPPGDGLEDDVP